mgnify:CR=1 FL=1
MWPMWGTAVSISSTVIHPAGHQGPLLCGGNGGHRTDEKRQRGYNRRKNIITRALGIGREVEPDFFEVDLEGGDYILLCSDGLSNMLEDQSMYEIITGEGSLKEKAALLIEEANRQGGH